MISQILQSTVIQWSIWVQSSQVKKLASPWSRVQNSPVQWRADRCRAVKWRWGHPPGAECRAVQFSWEQLGAEQSSEVWGWRALLETLWSASQHGFAHSLMIRKYRGSCHCVKRTIIWAFFNSRSRRGDGEFRVHKGGGCSFPVYRQKYLNLD